jgi:hypothetical protein
VAIFRSHFPTPGALTKPGAERISRGHPFYGEVIAHTASCAPQGERVDHRFSLAVWGRTRLQP